MLIMKRYIRSTTSDTTDITHDINKIRRNARLAAKRDGYDQVIILDRDGEYCFSRKYPGCCPEWHGEIVETIKAPKIVR